MKLRIFSIISALILVICATYTIVGSFYTYKGIWQFLFTILSNPFVSGVIYTICLLFIVFDVQITISKKMIKKDFRCNEIMEDVYYAIINYKNIVKYFTNENDSKNFIVKNRSQLYIINLSLSYHNNRILFDSLKTTFFLNLNFRLLGILNDIQNRIPNLTTGNKKVIAFLSDGKTKFDINDAKYYLLDLKFMVVYWLRLFNYLKYDNDYTTAIVRIYKQTYPDDFGQSVDVVSKHLDEIEKKYGKYIRKELRRLKKNR